MILFLVQRAESLFLDNLFSALGMKFNLHHIHSSFECYSNYGAMLMEHCITYHLTLYFLREQESATVFDFIHYSSRARETLQKLKEFMKEHVHPIEKVRGVVI